MAGGAAFSLASGTANALTNLLEFAFGTDPTVSTGDPIGYVVGGNVTTAGLPVATNFAVGGGVYFRAVFGRRKDYVSAGLTYTVQFSAGLDLWVNSIDTPTLLTWAPPSPPAPKATSASSSMAAPIG